MKIKKSLNANAVLAVNEDSSEYILFGKGIGYGKKMVVKLIRMQLIRPLFP